MSTIPEHIKQKIEDYTNYHLNIPRNKDYFKKGAKYGYSLAQEEIDKLNKTISGLLETGGSKLSNKLLVEKDKEIERLKGFIKEGFVLLNKNWKKTDEQIEIDWQQFKKQNNI